MSESQDSGLAGAESLAYLRARLRASFLREQLDLFGLSDGPWVDRATENWFNESINYDRRWRVIGARRPDAGRILDMASGCGTFVLFGLNHARDVVGIEPEPWKLDYFRRKVDLAGYPRWYKDRVVKAFGEELPFADASFDLVTTFQTLEHVDDVERCITEMVRVLRPGGVLYLRAPDYNCFFEPHYRVPFLPTMHKPLARRYVSLLGRPTAGVDSLNWTTEQNVRQILERQSVPLKIERNKYFFIDRRRDEIASRLSPSLRRLRAAGVINQFEQFRRKCVAALKIGRQERVIDLWITRCDAAGDTTPARAQAA